MLETTAFARDHGFCPAVQTFPGSCRPTFAVGRRLTAGETGGMPILDEVGTTDTCVEQLIVPFAGTVVETSMEARISEITEKCLRD